MEEINNFIENSDTGSTKMGKIEENIAENTEKPSSAAQNKLTEHDLFDEASKTAFMQDFPDVDLNKLRNSKDFQSFLSILTKNPSLSEIYACFNSISASAEEKSQKKLLQALANAGSGVGSLSSAQPTSEVFFTKEQVIKMSPDQIKQNFTQIRKSQAHW